MSDLDKLIEAVESGRARDFRALLADSENPTERSTRCGWAAAAFKGNLNAAKRLHEALLPDYGYTLGGWGARVWLYSDRPHWDGSKRQEVELPNMPARAWLLAILKAARAQAAP